MGGIAMIDEQAETKLILARLAPLFTAQWHCQYRIDVVNNPYGAAINFFLDIRRTHHRERSIPLHTVATQNLEVLERIVWGIRQETALTLNFVNFGHVRWPISQRWIR